MDKFQRLLILFVGIVPALLALSCANQVPPEGGPIDTSPPEIISTYPPPYTLFYSDHVLEFEFDKYVDHRSFEESIFISPFIPDLEFDWSGKHVGVTFRGTLRKNTTYVVNIGTDVKDLRSPPNRLAQAFTLAFSTGGTIDRGGIRGKVFPMTSKDPAEGVMIFAYQLAHTNPDTINPRTLSPDYITQTGTGGNFYLRHLELGSYRIIAVRDEYRNLLYDPEADEFGVPPHDVLLTQQDTLLDNVLLQLAKEDTTAPRLIRAEAIDVHHVDIEFSEALDTSSAKPVIVSIADTLSGNHLKAVSVFPKLPSLSSFMVVTDRQDSSKPYRITIDSAYDRVGLPIIQKSNFLVFMGSSIADTLLPAASVVGVQDSSRGVQLKPTILIQFSDAVQRSTFSNAIALNDTSNTGIPVSLDWLNDAACAVKVVGELASKTWYKLSIVTYNGLNWEGKRFHDSLKVVHFQSLDAEELSSIEGTVVNAITTEKAKSIVVVAEGLESKNEESYSTIADQKGNFLIQGIEEGRYVLHAFNDRNRNGKYDAGCPLPFAGSEQFNYATDTLKVRARWPLEGVTIELR